MMEEYMPFLNWLMPEEIQNEAQQRAIAAKANDAYKENKPLELINTALQVQYGRE